VGSWDRGLIMRVEAEEGEVLFLSYKHESGFAVS
jgi:hypothetical protein